MARIRRCGLSRIGRWPGRSTTREDLPRPPRPTDLGELEATLITRDDVAGEVDRALALEGARPARDVNAADEVPCSTWFCPRNHLQPMPPDAIAAGPPGTAPRLPLRIVKGKDQGAALGFQVVDADGRKYLLKLDPAGHLGMSTGAEIIGGAPLSRRRLQRPGQLRGRPRSRRSDRRSRRDLQALRGSEAAADRRRSCSDGSRAPRGRPTVGCARSP